MASTRNNNTTGNYCLQQRSIRMQREHLEYVHGATGTAYDPALPCLGFNPTHMPASTFSKNPVEIESSLFGIKTVKERAWFATPQLIMPKDLVVSTQQRPFPIPN